MQGRHPFCRGFAIQRRVQRSIGLDDGEFAVGYATYVPVLNKSFDLIVDSD